MEDWKDLIEKGAICKFEDYSRMNVRYGQLESVDLDSETPFKRKGDGDYFWGCEIVRMTDTHEYKGDVPEGTEKVKYVTDDRDMSEEEQQVLSIFIGGNGDYYVSTHPKTHRTGRAVRLAMSGGASSRIPMLCAGIATAYRAMANDENCNPVLVKEEV